MRGNATPEELRSFVERQHGVIARRQLLEFGLGAKAIESRVRAGRLVVVHRGVYAPGHRALRREGWWMAAVLACGPHAVLSHHAAAAAWGLRPPRGGRIDVSVGERTGRRGPADIRLHRVRSLPARETTALGAIPITTVARTLLDLAATLDVHHLEQAIHHADQLQRFDGRDVRAAIAAHPTRAGAPKLAALLDRLEGVGAQRTRSKLEVAFLALCADHELPRPVANARAATFEVDFHWPGTRLVVETDGGHHRMPAQRERDHAKRLALESAGYHVVVLTDRQVTRQPDLVAATLRRLLP